MHLQAPDRIVYETMRMSVLRTFLDHPKVVDRAYAFAWYHRMAAAGMAASEEDFDRFHAIRLDPVDAVMYILDEAERTKDFAPLAHGVLCRHRLLTPLKVEAELPLILRYILMRGDRRRSEVCDAIRINMLGESDYWNMLRPFEASEIKLPS